MSVELGGAEGLGLFQGEVGRARRSRPEDPADRLERDAHGSEQSRLTCALPDPCAFYHVHSFAPQPSNPDDVLATAEYGGEFVTAVEREPVYGVQFHPEKSGTARAAAAGQLRGDLRHTVASQRAA